MNERIVSGTIVALVLAAGVAQAQGPVADPSLPPGFSSWSELAAAQVPLAAAANDLESRLSVGPGNWRSGIEAPGRDGFASIELDVSAREVHLFWRGVPPSDVKAAVIATAQAHAATVVIKVAPFSRAQLEAEIALLLAASPSLEVRLIGPRRGGLGINLESELAPADVLQRPEVVQLRARLADPSAVAVSQSKPKLPLSRINDTSPFWGGARIVLTNTVWTDTCSSGFAVGAGASSYLFTAAHCSRYQTGWTVSNGSGVTIGNVAAVHGTTDSELVSVGNSQGKIYTGGVGVGETSKRIIGQTSSFPGMFMCASGALSGERCSALVQSTNNWITVLGVVVSPVVMMERLDHTFLAGQGDSGGPVFQAGPGDTAFAAGMVSAGDETAVVMCPDFPPPRICTWRVYYPQIFGALGAHGVSLKLMP